MRVAIYFAPAPASQLARLAAEWLGRDAFTNSATRERDLGIDRLVAEPARYGFHATMKAPFRLAQGRTLEELDGQLAAFCAVRGTVTIAELALAQIGPFFGLVPAGPEPALAELEESVVRTFEPLRAALTDDEIARRRPERLNERQRSLLAEWGYPHVLDQFRFHMTLTGPVPDGEADDVRARLASRFASFVGRPLVLDGLALFAQAAPGQAFRVHSHHLFGRA